VPPLILQRAGTSGDDGKRDIRPGCGYLTQWWRDNNNLWSAERCHTQYSPVQQEQDERCYSQHFHFYRSGYSHGEHAMSVLRAFL
jgi:hypothetical protein